MRNFVVIGEAAANLPPEVTASHRDVAWRVMADMRNILVHQYFGVDVTILWETAGRDLPPLVPRPEKMLEGSGGK